jgi:acyl carrier protein
MTDPTTLIDGRPESELRDGVRTIVAELAPEEGVPEVTDDHRLVEDLGFHSLAVLELAFTLEDQFDLDPIEEDRAAGIKTVRDIADLVVAELRGPGCPEPLRDQALQRVDRGQLGAVAEDRLRLAAHVAAGPRALHRRVGGHERARRVDRPHRIPHPVRQLLVGDPVGITGRDRRPDPPDAQVVGVHQADRAEHGGRPVGGDQLRQIRADRVVQARVAALSVLPVEVVQVHRHGAEQRERGGVLVPARPHRRRAVAEADAGVEVAGQTGVRHAGEDRHHHRSRVRGQQLAGGEDRVVQVRRDDQQAAGHRAIHTFFGRRNSRMPAMPPIRP